MSERRRPFQRHYADKAAPLVEAIHEQRTELQLARQEGDDESILALLGPLSESYRMLGQLDPAVSYGEEALALARKLARPRHVVSNGLRLATAMQYRNQQDEAEPLFREVLDLARSQGAMLDHVLQHYGKCLVELGRASEAIPLFEEALALREGRGDDELTESAEEALAGARKRLVTAF